MAREISCSEMSDEQAYIVFECAEHSVTNFKGEDPLEILLELEQLALEEGFADLHHFIRHYLE